MSQNILEVKDLHVSVADQEILKGVDLAIGSGETHVLMGPNGAGKSTLGFALMGHPRYKVTSGEILFQGKELLHKTFTMEECLDIMKGLEENRIDAILEGAGNDYHNDLDKMFTETFRNYILEHYADRNWESYREAPGNFDKFYCFADDSAGVYRFMENRGYLDLIDREKGFFEIVPKGYSKATCMDRLLEYLRETGQYGRELSLADTVAIGDSPNDIAMLRESGFGVAVENALPEVKASADFITASCDNDGVAKAIRTLLFKEDIL